MDSMLRFVAAGIGVAILPAMVLSDISASQGPVVVRGLVPRLTRSLVVARRRDRYFSAAAREFTRTLESAAHSDSGAAALPDGVASRDEPQTADVD
jgi:DNA-binding transcriptional LysR family regulator